MGDYTRMVDAALNKPSNYVPLYDHIVSSAVLEAITGEKFAALMDGDEADRREYFRRYNGFFEQAGYDAIPFECITSGILPGNKALYGHEPPSIHTMEDFRKYPWNEVPGRFKAAYYPLFRAFAEALPPGMRGVGGPGNGVFESVQDIVGFENLCAIKYEDEELYALLFTKMAETMEIIWKDFIAAFAGAYCVLRFGDDLGFKTSTLLSPDDIRTHIIPAYRKIITLVHRAGKPFLLHCCGKIFTVMDDLIAAGINAKHSNEDQIAPFPEWVDRYGSRIALVGGIDTDHLCRYSEQEIRALVKETCAYCAGKCGFAFGSGNSIADYVPPAAYLAMIEAVREFRGESGKILY
jgi:uroporphyrinogen decarboxylase